MPDALDPGLDDEEPALAGVIRLLIAFVVVLVLPIVLMAATMTSSNGCGGG